MTSVPNVPTTRYQTNIFCSDPTLPWSIQINYSDGFGWLAPYTALSGGTTIYSGTGTTSVYFRFSNGSYSTGNLIPREATINIYNDLDASNYFTYGVIQNIRSGNNNNGWEIIAEP